MKNRPLMGIDSLGRSMPALPKDSTIRKNKLTGLFYFLWLDNNNCKIYDVSKITAADPDAGYKPDSEVWGRVGDYHFWGEPFYGYYSQGDEWVVRKHMKLLTEAGLDFLFFDTTNALIYEDKAKLVMKVLQEYHDDGFEVPKVMFYTNTASGATVQKIYDAIYKPEFCKDTWFCLNGKPVIIAVESECSEETKAFFNIKMSQWPNEPDKLGGWPWMDFAKPQRVFANLDGVPEVINVSVAQHPQLRFGDSVLYGEKANCGRSFSKGQNDPAPYAYIKGANFEEQFERALETDPPIVLITGWNEWIAGRWEGIEGRPIMFVDCANYEYSRDIEMMRDGYFDNYYMQLAHYIRKYKGTLGCPVNAPGEVAEYYNFSDGDMNRDAMGQIDHYTNFTQRNALLKMTVSHDSENINITLTAKNPIDFASEDSKSGSFMNVFISKGTAPGFDFIINGKPDFDNNTASVELIKRALPQEFTENRPCDNLTETTLLAQIPMVINKTEVSYTIPRSLLGIETEAGFELLIKAADSKKQYTKVDQFYEDGDVMPLGRLSFVYRG